MKYVGALCLTSHWQSMASPLSVAYTNSVLVRYCMTNKLQVPILQHITQYPGRETVRKFMVILRERSRPAHEQ